MTVHYIEAPHHGDTGGWPAVFLAGGITGCADWQAEAVRLLDDSDVEMIVYNPRRANFDPTEPGVEQLQVSWEAGALRIVSAILFWFDPSGMQPIVHQEFGAALERAPAFGHHIVLGVHPDYPRRENLRHQVAQGKTFRLIPDEFTIHDTLEATAAAVAEAVRDESDDMRELRACATDLHD